MVSSNEMTQQPQDEFETSVENAEAWMKAIQERLRINDNTQGPRSALEARLRETEKICELEPEGRFKMDLVLMRAEALLQESSEDERHEIQTKLKDIKSLFEETTTYMTHCHSRIEWVWLHWSEYLKARDEFTLWLHNMKLTLEPDLEMQLGLKEKQWQHGHAQVLLKDVHNQATLLDRLLDEAAALYNRIGDPSVDEDVQNQMKGAYDEIKLKAQERVELLGDMMTENEKYQENVNQFRQWLNDVIEKLKGCVGGTTESTESRLHILQDIANDVKIGEQKLDQLDADSAPVITNTSPLGAEKIKAELEELRKALVKLKLMSDEEEEGLLKIHRSASAYQDQANKLEADIREFRKVIQRLESGLETGERVKSEEELIGLWRKYTATRSALAAEEPRVERLKLQLKELFRFSQDVQDPSNRVIAALRQYQSVKSKAFKLCTETESGLRQCFQNPLREFHHWKPAAQRVLDATADMTDLPMIQNFSVQMETLLEESSRVKERLMMLQLKKDFLSSVFGEEKAESVLKEVMLAAKEREALHSSLLQRKISLKASVDQSEDFDATFEPLQKSLYAIRIKVAAENEPQPDMVGKEAQLQRLQILHEGLVKLAPQIEELEIVAQSNPTNKHKISQLSSEYLTLKRSLEVMIQNSRQYVNDHRLFSNRLLDLQRWIMERRQDLESYQGVNGEWNFEDQESEIEKLLVELPEKEVWLHQVETHGHRVMENSSVEGAAHVRSELKHLNIYWASLLQLAEALARIRKRDQVNQIEMDAGKKAAIAGSRWVSGSPFFATGDIDATGKKVTIAGSEQETGLTPYSEHELTTPGKSMPAGGSDQAPGLTLHAVDERTAPGNKKGDVGGKWTFGSPSGEEMTVSGKKTSRARGKQAGDEMMEIGKKIAAAGNNWTFGSVSSSEADPATPWKKMAAGQSEEPTGLYTKDEIDAAGKGMAAAGSEAGTGIASYSGAEIIVHGKDVDAGQSRWAFGLPSEGETTAPGKKMGISGEKQAGFSSYTESEIQSAEEEMSAVGRKRETGSTSHSGDETAAPGGQIPAAGSKWTVGFSSHPAKGMAAISGQISGTKKLHYAEVKDSADYNRVLQEFEQWLRAENIKLNRILATKTSDSKEDIDTRCSKLLELQSRVPEGQRLFEALRHFRPATGMTEDLRMEDVRYQWMLYKSKLKDSGSVSTLKTLEVPVRLQKKPPGICSFLYRVCCAALPLQLLLLLLLLLAFLLPLAEENHSCTLANNFARSFSLMLRYEKPPPT